jgi:hypothetical protein
MDYFPLSRLVLLAPIKADGKQRQIIVLTKELASRKNYDPLNQRDQKS